MFSADPFVFDNQQDILVYNLIIITHLRYEHPRILLIPVCCYAPVVSSCSLSLTHWCRVTHICVGTNTNIGSDNGLSPGRHQAIIWTNAGMLLIGPLGTNFSGILIEIITLSFKKMRLKVSSAKWRPFCLGLNVLRIWVPGCAVHGACHVYSISQEICTRFCCALLCCGYAIVHNEFTLSIYLYSWGLLCWHWGNR